MSEMLPMGGEASQWEPALLDQTTPVEAHVGKENYHLTEDLADRCIKWIRNQQASAPDKPFMVYNTSFELTAELEIPEGGAEGVIICQGGNMAGWSLYPADGRPLYHYNWMGHEQYVVAGVEPVRIGKASINLAFDYDGGGLGKGGTARLTVNGRAVAEGRIGKTVPFVFSMSGETLDVGEDTGAPVGPYQAGNPFTGTIHKVEIEVKPALDAKSKREVAEGELVGVLRGQ
jgi:hypothetical protein